MAGIKKILIVEDDNFISSMYKIKLEQDGFAVIIAEDGPKGLEISKSEKPDLIMLDVMLPLLDGFAVLKELRADSVTKNTPVFLLTNLGTEEDKIKGKELGATDYLIKANFTPAQVSDTVKKYFKQ